MRDKLTMQGVEDFCSRNYGLRYGELARAFDVFLRAAGELMAMGYRIDTPIGSFARTSGLTYNSARKILNQWTQGNNPKLLKTRRGQEFIYTEL